jgi:hypothetical protein
MKRRLMSAALAALLSALAISACGAQTKTETAGRIAGEGTPGSSTAASTTTDTSTSSTTGTAGNAPSGGTAGPSTTRTATEPAFDKGEEPAQQAKTAAAVVRARGYTPANLSEYHPGQTLGLLVGTRTGSADGYAQQVFFFVDGRFIGTDAKEPSATVKVVSQNDTEAVVSYALYRPNDPLSSPSGGHAQVHFQLDNGKLMALETIPPVRSQSQPSRL